MASIQKRSLVSNLSSTRETGVMIEVMPNTAKTLKILDPIRFPREMAFSFLIMAIIDAANSGTLVPIETIVIPITRSVTPKSFAKVVAPFINNSEPPQSPNPPKAKNKTILYKRYQIKHYINVFSYKSS